MEFSKLITNNSTNSTSDKELVVEGLFDGKPFDIKSWDSSINSFAKASSEITSNPVKELIGIYTGGHPWRNRDFGKEVFELENAKGIISLTGDFKNLITELEKLRDLCEKERSKTLQDFKKISLNYKEEVKDSPKEADKTAKKAVKLANNLRKKDYDKIVEKVEFYRPQFKKAIENMKKYESALADATHKKETADINQLVKNKKAESRKNAWKQNVKSIVTFNHTFDDTTGAAG